jgi:hypothetical protein
VNLSKAFAKVNYWNLFTKLSADKISSNIIGTIAFWYSHQRVVVRMVKGRNSGSSGILSYDIRSVGLIKSHPLISNLTTFFNDLYV